VQINTLCTLHSLFYPEPEYYLNTNHTVRKTSITSSIMLGMNTKTIKEIPVKKSWQSAAGKRIWFNGNDTFYHTFAIVESS
jgi:hypothetical protein